MVIAIKYFLEKIQLLSFFKNIVCKDFKLVCKLLSRKNIFRNVTFRDNECVYC